MPSAFSSIPKGWNDYRAKRYSKEPKAFSSIPKGWNDYRTKRYSKEPRRGEMIIKPE